MTDFGGKLRQARERRGVSLRQIAASTKISVAALEALERNDVSKLPGGIFSRAFVRSYAVEVGLDPDDTVREFLERFSAEPAGAGAGAVASVPEQETAFESQQRMASVLLKIILFSLLLGAVILYFTLRNRSADPPPIPGPPGAAATLTPPGPTPATAPTSGATAAAPSIAQPITLELHPTGLCWVALTIDNRRVMARVMQAGERQTFRIENAAMLEVGDPATFAFSIDGRPGRSLGEAGRVKTARITRETMGQLVR
jgi:cytoskeletal protein RodZ